MWLKVRMRMLIIIKVNNVFVAETWNSRKSAAKDSACHRWLVDKGYYMPNH